MVMQGLSASSIKKHPALIPLFLCLGVGMAGAIFYTMRLALRNPDVSWNKKKNAEPWQEWDGKQYKFLNLNNVEHKSVAPKY